jgi:hypothetical protein
VNRISEMSGQTLTEGVKEREYPGAGVPEKGRNRKAGGGRKPVGEEIPGYV